MIEEKFELRSEMIMLNSLLKATGIAATGGHAGMMIEEGAVLVNGETEGRKRRKLIKGDSIQVQDTIITLV